MLPSKVCFPCGPRLTSRSLWGLLHPHSYPTGERVSFVPQFPGPGSGNPARIYSWGFWLKHSRWVPRICVSPDDPPWTLAEFLQALSYPQGQLATPTALLTSSSLARGVVTWASTFCQTQGQKSPLRSQVWLLVRSGVDFGQIPSLEKMTFDVESCSSSTHPWKSCARVFCL